MGQIITLLVVGLIAGWLAGVIMKGRGFGIFIDILVGVAGAFLGNWIFGTLFGVGFVGDLLKAFIGAIILLFVIKLIKKK